MVCVFPQAFRQLREIAGPAGIKRPIGLQSFFAVQLVLIGLKMNLALPAGLMRPLPARTPERCHDSFVLARRKCHGAVNVEAAGGGAIEGADKARSAAQRILQLKADSVPKMVEGAFLVLLSAPENVGAEVEGEARRPAAVEDRGHIGRRAVQLAGFLPCRWKPTLGALAVLPLRR